MRLRELIREHRMRDTFGGYDWGDPIRLWTAGTARDPMSREEFIDELDWFRDSGMSAAITLQQLGSTFDGAEQRCLRARRNDLAAWVRAARPKAEAPEWADRRAA